MEDKGLIFLWDQSLIVVLRS
uniref:Uncharacterized protein n=1 Tax=Rhizophora mucronata TaxID=61149 RepID=A0A2P2NE79_RHIMU